MSPLEQESLSSLIEQRLRIFFETYFEGSTPKEDNIYNLIMQQVETPLLKLCLEFTKGNQIKTASILGINRNTLRQKIEKAGIDLQQIKKQQK